MAEGRTAEHRQDDLPEAPPTKGKDQAVILGVFLVVGIIATLGALFVLTDAAIFRGRYIVVTNVPDAGGIRRGDPVQMRGVNIGRVQRFQISSEGVAVSLEIEGEYTIPKDSYVQLKAAGLLGGMVAEVVPGRSTEGAGYGSVLSGRTEQGALTSTNALAGKAEDVLARVEEILTPQFRDTIHGSSSELHKALTELSATIGEQRQQLSSISGSLRQATGGPELERTVKRLDTLTARMDGVTTSLEKTAKSAETVMGRLEKGQGSLGKVVQDETLYNNLNQTSVNMNKTVQNLNQLTDDTRALITDIKKNPKRYFSFSVF
jgi:phospholipid/cholesterol/gamma-HCH transport system substrate-binding protein